MRAVALPAAVLVVLTVSASAPGQTTISSAVQSAPYVPTLTYDVTSVRQCPPGPQNNGFNDPLHSGRLLGICDWAQQLIGWAYGVDWRVQVVGGPDWVKMARSNEVRFQVQATADSATDAKLARLSDDQARLEKEHMLRALLEDRFGLKAHMETRPEPAFALTVAKRGPKLEKGKPMGPPRPEHPVPGTWHPPIESERDPRGIRLVARGAAIGGATLGSLAGSLQFTLGKRVIDETGITGTYNFTLQFHGTLSDMQAEDDSTWPPVETAVREQLGLELKDTKAPLEVLVIDRIEMPSAN